MEKIDDLLQLNINKSSKTDLLKHAKELRAALKNYQLNVVDGDGGNSSVDGGRKTPSPVSPHATRSHDSDSIGNILKRLDALDR